MDRKEFLQKLIHKSDMKNGYVASQLYQNGSSVSPPSSIKRMQIYYRGLKKEEPAKKDNPNLQISSYNKGKVLILQKVKIITQRKEEKNRHEIMRKNKIDEELRMHDKDTLIDSPVKTCKTQNSEKRERESQSFVNTKSDFFASIKHCHSSMPKKNSVQLESEGNSKITQESQFCSEKQIEKMSLIKDIQVKFESKMKFSKMNIRSTKSEMKKEKGMKNSTIPSKKEAKKTSFPPVPKLTALAFVIYQKVSPRVEPNGMKVHLASNSKMRVEVASLTKIMTCLVALELCERFMVKAEEQQIRIDRFQASIGGTSAKIQEGDRYTLEDMLYGLMLPSGNDASLALAVWGGKKLLESENKWSQGMKKKQAYERFIQEMNRKSRILSLAKTNYANSHGLVNTMNRSCAHDIAILSQLAMRNPQFRKIVSTKSYSAKVRMFEKKISFKELERTTSVLKSGRLSQNMQNNEEECSEGEVEGEGEGEEETKVSYEEEVYLGDRETTWTNTHKLLHQNSRQYIGIKTGVTTAAGPCLSTCVLSECGRTFFIVVLKCKKLSLRFKETEKLKKWVFKKQKIMKNSKLNNQSEVGSIISYQNQNQNEEELSDNEQKYGSEVD